MSALGGGRVCAVTGAQTCTAAITTQSEPIRMATDSISVEIGLPVKSCRLRQSTLQPERTGTWEIPFLAMFKSIVQFNFHKPWKISIHVLSDFLARAVGSIGND